MKMNYHFHTPIFFLCNLLHATVYLQKFKLEVSRESVCYIQAIYRFLINFYPNFKVVLISQYHICLFEYQICLASITLETGVKLAILT